MLSMYPACFFHENDSYSVIFPDLNYLATQGDTFEEAMEMAVDCLAGYLHTCQTIFQNRLNYQILIQKL